MFKKIKKSLIAVGAFLGLVQMSLGATALDTFGSSVAGEVTSIAAAVASAMGAGLAIFAIIFGGRVVLRGVRAVGK